MTENSIIILDEAHNIEKIANQSFSTFIDQNELKKLKDEDLGEVSE